MRPTGTKSASMLNDDAARGRRLPSAWSRLAFRYHHDIAYELQPLFHSFTMAPAKRKVEDTAASDEETTKRSRVDAAAGQELIASTSSHTAEFLLTLLDLSSLTSQEDISARFDAIGEALLHHFWLRVKSINANGVEDHADYEVLELEFYLYSPGCHEDPFTHGSEEQRHSGRWCV